ncbi:MAG TPA: FtsK/SpoIIIE domain-containing protein [Actinomycetota bacterium]|nr:FtsK/SpoIIIE domain-containing protein [Actinomycetota bacterium]
MDGGADRFSGGLIVRLPDAEREVNADCDPGEPAGVLVDAILAAVGLPGGGSLYVARTERWLDRERPLLAQPLSHGDLLLTEPPNERDEESAETTEEACQLVGAGGVAIGGRWALGVGRHSVGRGTGCDVVVDDAALSRTHLLLEVERDEVRVNDAGSTNGTFIAGVRLTGARALAPGEVIEAGASLFTIERNRPGRGAWVPDTDGFVRFNRPPRVTPRSALEPIVVPAPPGEARKARLPIASAALPLIAALVLWRLFPDNPSLLLIMALSPLMVIFSFVDERRRGRGSARTDEQRWRDELDKSLESLGRARDAAVALDRQRAPGAAELESWARSLSPSLWLRRPGDADFLLLRCGWGDRRWDADVSLEPGGSDALREEALGRLGPLRVLPSVPLTAHLGDLKVVGLTGDVPRVSDLVRWWIVQASTLHSPEELRLVLLVPDAEAEEWSWATWLPHVPNEPSEGRLRPALEQLHAIVHLLEARREASSAIPAIVVVVDERAGLPRALTARLLREGPSQGMHVLWHNSRREDLPGECAALIELDQNDGMTMTVASTGETVTGAFEGIDAEAARRVALALAPIRDAAPRSGARELSARVTLFDVLGAEAPDVEWVARRWRAADSGLRAPVGRSAKGAYILDLIDDGPHALVGGTTGSGKSELLQTAVAALAATYPPTHLNFLLIDYKGGAAFKDCALLPHSVGSVTDLDAHLSERALVSLDAEVRRRETVLRDAGVRDIRELDEEGSEPLLPRLVLVVDEFATLIKELPAFVDGVVDVAQRGRSLGIHVVLATQRPAGVISDAIRANTNLRIALRMADETDSDNVVGIKDAAHIPRSTPGRAYARTGHGEVQEVQSAFGGAIGSSGALAAEAWDRNNFEPGRGGASGSGPTQLERLVPAIRAAAEAEDRPAPRRPWLPPLADSLALLELEPAGRASAPIAVLGLSDLPGSQRQELATFDPAVHGGLIVFGAGGSGKTTVLRTIAASLARSSSPDQVHIYGVDYGGAGLRRLSLLPHVGDVVSGNEPARVERLFHRLRAELNRRKQSAKSGAAAVPTIIVLLDGYASFASAFERVDMGALVDGLPTLIAEGRSLGIHFVVAAERRAGVPQSLIATIDRKLILRMADPDEYATLGLDSRRLRGTRLAPGRGFIDGVETQIATVSGTDSATEESAQLEALARSLPKAGHGPAEVKLLPAEVSLDAIDAPATPLHAVLGLVEAEDLAPGVLDLTFAHFLVAGPYRSGRSTALAALATSLRTSTPDAEFHLLAPRRSPLGEMSLWTGAAVGVETCGKEIGALSDAFDDAPERIRFVLIDDADELLEGSSVAALEQLVRRGRDSKTRFLVAGEVRALHRAFSGWITEVRKDKHGVLLDPDPDVDGDLLGVRLPRRRGSTLPPGRGYLIRRGSIEAIQVALP